jgi:mRNA interferase MazF
MTRTDLPRRWGIHRVDLGQRLLIGSRPGKTRPCLAIQPSELALAGLRSTVVLPLTTRLRDGAEGAFPLRVRVPAGTAGLRQTSDVMIDQMLACGHASFRGRIGLLPPPLRDQVREALRDFLDL